MLRLLSVLLLLFVVFYPGNTYAGRAKEPVVSQEGFCFIGSKNAGNKKLKKYMFAGSDGIIYEIASPRFSKSYKGKELVLQGKVRTKAAKDGSITRSIVPRSINLVVEGIIDAKKSKKTRRWRIKLKTDDKKEYQLTGYSKLAKIATDFNGKRLKLWGRLKRKKLKSGKTRNYLEVTGYEGEVLKKAKKSSKKKKDVFAKTEKKLPGDELTPGAAVTIELPELGNSSASKGKSPIEMTTFLPDNYNADRKHPVIIHFSGGLGSSRGGAGWKNVTGSQNFILVGADYSHKENEEKGMLKYGTCRDFDYKIAAHCLQILKNSTAIDEETIVLAGLSSGGYSITYSLGCDNTDIFAGFCPIIGGTDRCKKANIGEKTILFVAGENDNTHKRTQLIKDAVKALKKKNDNVQLYIQEGVGHSWDSMAYPVQKKWLFTEFKNLAKYRRWQNLAENSEYPEAKQYYADKIEKSWFKCPTF